MPHSDQFWIQLFVVGGAAVNGAFTVGSMALKAYFDRERSRRAAEEREVLLKMQAQLASELQRNTAKTNEVAALTQSLAERLALAVEESDSRYQQELDNWKADYHLRQRGQGEENNAPEGGR